MNPSDDTGAARQAPWSTFVPARSDRLERRVFREHLISSAWNGISAGLILLTDVILAKTLGAPGWQITLLATLNTASLLFSFYWAGAIRGRAKGGSFLLAVLVGRLPLLLILLPGGSPLLIALHTLYGIASGLLATATNSVYQNRYTEETRAVRFAVATSVGAIFAILASQASGILLERHEHWYPWLIGASGVTGAISAFHLYRMELADKRGRTPWTWLVAGGNEMRRQLGAGATPEGDSVFRTNLRSSMRILRENRDFVRFERDFMIYGFAFLSVWPVLPVYIVRDLKMDYGQLSAAKGLWSQVGIVLVSPFLGLALRRLSPLRFTGRVFLMLALYPLCLLVSTIPELGVARIPLVYVSLFFFSVAMAGVNLSWTLGSMHFAGEDDAAAYQGLHVALTGLRGLLAPSLGYAVHVLLGPAAVFTMSTVLFLIAGTLMLRHHRDALRAAAVS
jgi:MFS family permease